MSGIFPAARWGSVMRCSSLRALKSTTTNPLKSPIWTNSRLVEPSGFFAIAKLDVPGRCSGRDIEDADVPLAAGLARHDVLAVRRDVEVVHGAFGADALHLGERRGVDDIGNARVPADGLPDAHVHLPSIGRDRDVVRVARE